MAFQLEVWGDYALFTRPEMKVERVSYDVMTPSAARGILDAILWHPGLRWVVDRLYVLSPIRFTGIRRNEVSKKISANTVRSAMNTDATDLFLNTKDFIQQRASMVLQDVHYVIEAHFVLTDKAAPSDNEGKFCEMFRRRASRGQSYHQPYFGTREFPVHYRLWQGGEITTAYPDEERDLGYMLYDMDYTDPKDIQPTFFRAVMKNGIVDFADAEVVR